MRCPVRVVRVTSPFSLVVHTHECLSRHIELNRNALTTLTTLTGKNTDILGLSRQQTRGKPQNPTDGTAREPSPHRAKIDLLLTEMQAPWGGGRKVGRYEDSRTALKLHRLRVHIQDIEPCRTTNNRGTSLVTKSLNFGA